MYRILGADRREYPGSGQRTVFCVLLGCAAAGGVVLFCFDPSRYHFYPICLFHETTGLLCAGCGSSRALHQLLHGHLTAAFRYNPLLMVSLPVLVWWAGKYLLLALSGRRASMVIRPVWLWLGLGVLVAFTVLRNLPGCPVALLPPP